jgi:hypothetical protein
VNALKNKQGVIPLCFQSLNSCMRLIEITGTIKPLSPEQARVKAMKQGIARQKAQLAAERERQHDTKHAKQMRSLQAKASGM